MKEMIFKAKRINNGEWVEGYYVKTKWYCAEREMHIIISIDSTMFPHCEISEYFEVDESTLCQYTGLTDSTKWDELTEKEKEDFYNQNRSEDGGAIKYQRIDDVKHLWRGRKIWENDIIYYGLRRFVIHYYKPFAMYMLKGINRGGGVNGMTVQLRECKVIGNIFDNPELLEKEGVKHG